jgi:hypothetical protein
MAPYVVAAAIGAATIASTWLVQAGLNSLEGHIQSWPVLYCVAIGGLILTAFSSDIILLLLYRFIIDRTERKGDVSGT